jgi:hypothetical protein
VLYKRSKKPISQKLPKHKQRDGDTWEKEQLIRNKTNKKTKLLKNLIK